MTKAQTSKKNAATKQNQPSIKDVETVIAQIEAYETQADNPSETTAASSVTAPAGEEQTFEQLTNTFDDALRLNMAVKLGQAFDDRSAYERTKNPANERIHKVLDGSRAKLVLPSATAVLLATGMSPEFINRSLSNGSRFNVYAAQKLTDLVIALRDGVLRNAINLAIVKSLFAFQKAGEVFTGEMAKAAACDKVKVPANLGKLLTRHTVDPGTMSTQTSSTMTALMALGIVENKGTFRAPIYELTVTPQTNRLKEVLAL